MFMTAHEGGTRMDLILQVEKLRLREVKGLAWGYSAHESRDWDLPDRALLSASRSWGLGCMAEGARRHGSPRLPAPPEITGKEDQGQNVLYRLVRTCGVAWAGELCCGRHVTVPLGALCRQTSGPSAPLFRQGK